MTDKQIKEVFKNGFYCIEPCPEIKELQAELKAKEQECEEKSWEIGNLGYKIKNQRKEINIRLEQLDKIKAENDKLKEAFDGLFKVQYKLADNCKKLRQCLTEIKEIAERCGKRIPLFETDEIADDLQQILQKISECEGEE